MPPPPIIGTTQAKVFKAITVEFEAEAWDVKPFDNTGKVVLEQYIDLDLSNGSLDLNLPDLAIFNRVYGTTIYVTVVTGGETGLTIIPFDDQQIGSSKSISGPSITGLNFIIQPVSETEWSVNITFNAPL